MKILNLFLPLYPWAAAAGVLLLQATVAAFLGVALSALAGRHRPALRSAVGGCAFAAILFSPLGEKGLRHAGLTGGQKPLTWVFQRPPFSAAWADRRGSANSAEQSLKDSPGSDSGQDSKPASERNPASTAVVLRSIAGLVLTLWAVGSVGLFLRMIGGLFRLAGIRRSAVRLADRPARVAEDAAAEIGLQHTPRIYSTPSVCSPLVAGLGRPCILLPSPVYGALSTEQLREVFLHEFAHILRRDLWIGLAQRVSVAAFWPSPFVHWLNASLNRAREEVCDNYVLARVDAAAYAQTLLHVATGMPGVPATACALGHESNLVDRVALLLDSKRNTTVAIHKPMAGLLLAGFVVSASWIGLCAEEPGVARALDPKPDFPAASTASGVIEPGGEALAQAIISWNWTWENVTDGPKSIEGIQFYRGGSIQNSSLWTARWRVVGPRMLVIENPAREGIEFGEKVDLVFDADFTHYVGFDFNGTTTVEGFRREALDPKRQPPEAVQQAPLAKGNREDGAQERAPAEAASPVPLDFHKPR